MINQKKITVLTKKLEISGVQIDNAENLDLIMPMYNLLQHSKNYKKTAGSL